MGVNTKRALIVVRTYPTPAKTGVEVSCTAAITDGGEWLRLFPIPYRRLEAHQKFHKYQWIEVDVDRATKDPRPESYRIRQDTLRVVSEVLPSSSLWQARKDVVFPLLAPSLCAIQRRRDEHKHPTLGIFRPAQIKRLVITPTSAEWSAAQQAILGQQDLFEADGPSDLEKIPYDFAYEFTCDERECTGHRLKCTDWEMGQSYREWRRTYGDDWEAAFRNRYEREMIEVYDTHFYVGTLKQHQGSWIIVGLFYPQRPRPLPLFGE